MKNINRKIFATASITLVVGFLLGWMIFRGDAGRNQHEHSHGQEKSEIWTCSMHPQIRSKEPGKCPLCGMDLVRLANVADDNTKAVHMTETAIKLANIQTTIVGSGNEAAEIQLNGKVQADERKVYTQVTHISGRIEKLQVNFTGDYVKRGQTLATLYSPELTTAQEELLQAYKIRETQPDLYNAARSKLRNWKLSDETIDNMIAKGERLKNFPITADVSGIVITKRVNPGDYLERGMPLYDIADLSQVWVLFDVYENDLSRIRKGEHVTFTVQSIAGKIFAGKVSFIDAVINPTTRVASARVEVNNVDFRLKPEMFVKGYVKQKSKSKDSDLIIPKSAVLWTGERSVVYVRNQDERGVNFEMREVTLGSQIGNGYLIVNGLTSGEAIVTNGTFAVDAAAQLEGKPSMMNPTHHIEIKEIDQDNSSGVKVNPGSKDLLKKIFDSYFGLKDALVKDDIEGALKISAAMKKIVDETDMTLFNKEEHRKWMALNKNISSSLNLMSSEKNIEAIRAHFMNLSTHIISLAKSFGAVNGIMYVQHCPMADSNKGADWLSKESEIRNPYFGNAMLTCGEVINEIK